MSNIIPKNFQSIYITNIANNSTTDSVLTASSITTSNLLSTNISSNSLLVNSLIANGNSNTLGTLFTTGGNIGIGTTAPASLVDIRSGSSVNINLQTSSARTQIHSHSDTRTYFQSSGDIMMGANIASTTLRNMYLTTSGNVGIGTTSPTRKLQVTGSIVQSNAAANDYNGYLETNFSDQSSTTLLNPGILVHSASGTYNYGMDLGHNGIYRTRVFAPNTADISFAFATTSGATSQSQFIESMVIKGTSGNIGIGTTNPIFDLDVTGSIRATSGITTGTLLATTQVSSGNLYSTNVTSTNMVSTNISSNTLNISTLTTGSILVTSSINSSFNSNTIGNIFTTGGNTGFNITAPLSTIHINKNVAPTTSGSVNAALSISNGGNGTAINFGTRDIGVVGQNYSWIQAQYNNSANTTQILSFNPLGGNIGIGTTSPLTTLDINGILNIYGTSKSLYGGIGTELSGSIINFGLNDTRFGSISTTGTQGGFYRVDSRSTENPIQIIVTNTSGTVLYPLQITTAGRVGINTTNPAFTLDVNGSIDASTFLTSGNVYSTNITSTNIVGTTSTIPNIVHTNITTASLLATTQISSANLYSTNVTSTNIVGTNISSSSLISTNNTLTNLTLVSGSIGSLSTGNISISGNITVGGNLLVQGSLISVNVTSVNVINNNITAGALNATNVTATNIVGTNVTINSASTTPLIVSTSFSGAFTNLAYVFAPNQTNGNNNCSTRIFHGQGVGASYNSGQIGFNYIGSGNVNNFASYGMYGVSPTLNVNGNGYVGISNTGPIYPLDISGTTRIINTTATCMGTLIVAGPGNSAYSPATTTIGQLASFYGPGGANSISNFDLSTYLPSSIQNNLPSVRFSMLDGGNGNSNFNILTRNSGSTGNMVSRIMVDTSGNIGINNTVPNVKLDFGASAANHIISLYTLNTVSNTYFGFGANNSLLYYMAGVNSGHQFYNNSGYGTLGTALMTLASSGNVGIGTTSPRAALQVETASTAANAIMSILAVGGGGSDTNFFLSTHRGNDTNNVSGAILTKIGLNYDSGAGTTVGNSFIRFHRGFSANGGFMSFSSDQDIERMRVTSSGNIGIGTTAPSFTLDINGSVRVTTNITVGGVIYTDGAGGIQIAPTTNGGESSIGFWQNAANTGRLWVLGHNTANVGSGNFCLYNDGISANCIVVNTAGNSLFSNGFSQGGGSGTLNSLMAYPKLIANSNVNNWPTTFNTGGNIISFRVRGGDDAVLDMGVNSGNGTWLQSTNYNNYTLNYSLMLNPNGGNIGINTTSATHTLDIKQNGAANINLQNYGSGASQLRLFSNNDSKNYFQTSGDIFFTDIGQITQRSLSLTTGGNVNIGASNTFSPYSKLTLISGNNGTNITQASIAFSFAGGPGYYHFMTSRHNALASSNQNALDFYMNNSASQTGSTAPNFGNINSMSITATGIGIFNTNPLSAIDIKSGAIRLSTQSTCGILFSQTNSNQTNGNCYSSIYDDANLHIWTDDTFYIDIGGSNGNGVVTGATNAFYINSSRNVGIGTTGPTGRLHVYESTGTSPGGNAGALIISRGNTGGSSCITFPSVINNGSDYGFIQFIDSVVASGFTGYNYFGAAGTETAALVIGCQNDGSGASGSDSVIISPVGNVAITPSNGLTYISGNVGIRTTSPNDILQVSNVMLMASAGNLTVTGDVLAFGTISDQRLKENVNNIENGLGTINNLRPVTFNWKEDIFNTERAGTSDSGFIAQEVEPIIPHAVGEFKEIETGEIYKNMRHERIIPYLVKAIQELHTQNKILTTQIQELQNKLH